jgi:hypothetical protein
MEEEKRRKRASVNNDLQPAVIVGGSSAPHYTFW